MDAVQRTHRFRWERFVALVAVGVVLSIAIVEFCAPERFFRVRIASAEVELLFRAERPPTAEQVRRRALSPANLTAVYRRLMGRVDADFEDDEAAESVEQFDRWRRLIAVEVRTIDDRRRRLVRFLAENADRLAEASVLAEAVAAQYASDIAAEVTPEVVTAEGPSESDDEFVDLMQTRARLLETMQPAHPDVVALDARLGAIRTAASGSPIRRASAELEDSPPRDVVAAEIPVVTTRDALSGPWEQRPFWHVAAWLLAFCIAWPASRGRRTVSRESDEPRSRFVAPPRPRTSDPTVVLRRRDRAASNAP